MSITLPADAKEELVARIQHYFLEERDEEIGQLQASFFLDFAVEVIGPHVYNQAIRDAQTHLQAVVTDLDVVLYEPEAPR